MGWLILWLLLSLPVAMAVGAFIALGNRRGTPSRWADHLGPEMHDQTIVG